MSKGIIVRVPGGGMPAGKIIMIEGSTVSADGRAAAIDAGTIVSYIEASPAQVGDLVDLTVDPTNVAKGIIIRTPGNVISGVIPDNVEVGPADVITLNAASLEGTITVNGGIITIIGGTTLSGVITAPVAGSVILIDQKCAIDGAMMVKTASIVSVRNSTFNGRLSTNGTNFTAVETCTIKGRLEVVNAKDCYSAGNQVDGSDGSGACRH